MAAAGMLTGLFTPQQPQDDDTRLQNLAAMDPFQAARYASLSGSQMAGQGIGRVVASTAGADTRMPAERSQAVARAIQASGLQPGTEEYYTRLAQEFSNNGLPDAAANVQQAWEAMRLQRAHAKYYEGFADQKERVPAKDQLMNKYWQTVQQIQEQGDAADPGLLKARDNLAKALNLKESDWTIVQPTTTSPGYRFNKVTGEAVPLDGRIAPAGGLGSSPDFWYEYYEKTGKLPPIAWGQAGNQSRQEFIDGFPKWKAAQGGGGGASGTAASQASFHADTGALNALTRDLNTFEPYKKMLDTNADIAIQLGQKISQTNSQLANKGLNWLRQNATSNPDVAEYLAQMRFVQTEAARVINNPRIVGQLTDEARREMDSVISGNAPIAVVERVLNRLKTDGNNRFNAMRDQQVQITDRLKSRPTGTSGAPAAAPGKDDFVRVMSPDGKAGKIPRANLQRALDRGFKVMQ